MKYTRKCKVCKKVFSSSFKNKKYCSKSCIQRAMVKVHIKNSQPCWYCKNACGGCSWSSKLQPVNGWDAELVVIKDTSGDFTSYKIKKCPEYQLG